VTALVIDASAFVETSLQSGRGRRVAQLLAKGSWHVPAHFDAEVLGAYARLHRRGLLDTTQVEQLLLDLEMVEVTRHGMHRSLRRAWRRTANLSTGDALYAELTAQLTGTLVTCDASLASQVAGALLVE
jgi:predicted nucleic acid-binding protein